MRENGLSSFETRPQGRSSEVVKVSQTSRDEGILVATFVNSTLLPWPGFSHVSPPAPPSLDVLRQEIDAIDEQVHRLLMARGDIIDRLIQVKQTQEVGSAFRPRARPR